MEERIQRNLKGRNRTAIQFAYKPGMYVDFWRKTEKKQLQGWRGPATVLALLGEGYLTLRWQSHVLDIPVNHCRPHVHRVPLAIPATAKPNASIEEAAAPEAAAALEEPSAASEAIALPNAAFVESWERYWMTAATDIKPSMMLCKA